MGPKARTVKFYSTVSDRSEVVHLIARLFNSDGGPGSGNHGHAGRPGKVGGSAPGEGGGTNESSSKKSSTVATSDPKNRPESVSEREEGDLTALRRLQQEIKGLSRFGEEGKKRNAIMAQIKEINERLAPKKPESLKPEEIAKEVKPKSIEEFDELLKTLEEERQIKMERVYELGNKTDEAYNQYYRTNDPEDKAKAEEASEIQKKALAEAQKVYDKIKAVENEKKAFERAEKRKNPGEVTAIQVEMDRIWEESYQKTEEREAIKNEKNKLELMASGKEASDWTEEERRHVGELINGLNDKIRDITRERNQLDVEWEEKRMDLSEAIMKSETKEGVEKRIDENEEEIDELLGKKEDAQNRNDEFNRLVGALMADGEYEEAKRILQSDEYQQAMKDRVKYGSMILTKKREQEMLKRCKSDLIKREEREKAQSFNGTEAEYRDSIALDIFGDTDDYHEAGWMLLDGTMLNFSGEKDSHPGERGFDHREIGQAYPEYGSYSVNAMQDFRKDGNIRIYPEVPGINLSSEVEPTESQYDAIRDIIDKIIDESHENKGDITGAQFCIDLSDEYGDMFGHLEYSGDPDDIDTDTQQIDADEIISDIKHWYETKEVTEEFGKPTFNGDSAQKVKAKDGGPGSGNHGHAGRPGQVGGSASGEGGSGLDPTGEESGPKKSDSSVEIRELKKRISKLSRFGSEGKTREMFVKILERLEGEEEKRKLEEKGQKASEGQTAQKVSFASAPDSAKTLRSYAEFSDRRNSEILKDLNIPEEDVKNATDRLAKIFDENEYGLFIDPQNFLDSVMDTHFKNQFETGTSRGTFSPTMRKEAAEKLFGINPNENLSGEDMEKYGALVKGPTGAGCNAGFGYGGLAVTFKKDRLAGRVTYTLTDSLTIVTDEDVPTMSAGSVSVGKTTFGGAREIKGSIEFLKKLPYDMCGDLSYINSQLATPYIELQYHGNLTVDDVDTVCFKSENDLYRHLTPEKEKALKDRGITVGYRGGKLNDEFIVV